MNYSSCSGPLKKLFQSSQSQGRKLLCPLNVPLNLDIFAECLLQILLTFLINFLGDPKQSPSFLPFFCKYWIIVKMYHHYFSPLDLICSIFPFYACDMLLLPYLITLVDFSGSFRDQYLWIPKIVHSQIKH